MLQCTGSTIVASDELEGIFLVEFPLLVPAAKVSAHVTGAWALAMGGISLRNGCIIVESVVSNFLLVDHVLQGCDSSSRDANELLQEVSDCANTLKSSTHASKLTNMDSLRLACEPLDPD